jgi:hypothetical protein
MGLQASRMDASLSAYRAARSVQLPLAREAASTFALLRRTAASSSAAVAAGSDGGGICGPHGAYACADMPSFRRTMSQLLSAAVAAAAVTAGNGSDGANQNHGVGGGGGGDSAEEAAQAHVGMLVSTLRTGVHARVARGLAPLQRRTYLHSLTLCLLGGGALDTPG